jgi:hypothetical protein
MRPCGTLYGFIAQDDSDDANEIERHGAIRTALVQLRAACELDACDSGTADLISAFSDAIPLVNWKAIVDSNAEGTCMDVLVEVIDDCAQVYLPAPGHDEPGEA